MVKNNLRNKYSINGAAIRNMEHQRRDERILAPQHCRNLFARRAVTKGRSVAEQFAHIHNVRLMWLNAAEPDLLITQTKLEKGLLLSIEVLLKNLQSSKLAMAELLQSGLTSGRIKGFKPHPQAFLGYLIAHEAHHRGQIIQTLKQNGHLPDKKVLFGLWEWGTTK